MSYAKWIGGALGWAVGGPLGGVLGFAFGSVVDDGTFTKQGKNASGSTNTGGDQSRYEKFRHHTRPGDFSSSLLVLFAYVMKADSKLMRSELDFIREFLSKQFGPSTAAEHIGILKELLKKEIPIKDVCHQIRHFMEHPMRLQLLHYLFGIARADGDVHRLEVQAISDIAEHLGISAKDYESIKAMFYKDSAAAYTILEIDSSVTDEDVKKAFRKMAMKYHPDKIRGLGEQHVKAAEEKFIKVQEAYDLIKKERGIK